MMRRKSYAIYGMKRKCCFALIRASRMNSLRILHLRKSEGFFGAERVILALSKGAGDHDSTSWIGCINDSRNPCNGFI